MARLDPSTFAGLGLALAGIIGGQLLEGGNPASLVQGAGFCIVFLGTIGAVLAQTRLSTFVDGVKLGWWTLSVPAVEPQRTMRDVTRWAEIVRKEGLLKLEGELRPTVEPFTRRGLELLIDGGSPDDLRDIMALEIAAYEERLRQAARIWDAAGGYAPTIGILGAVLGLIQVMQNLSDPSRLGAGIAVAFVSTIYGVALANLLFLPIANKVRALIAERVRLHEMLVEGLAAIANGDHPRLITRRLQGYCG
ncbi:MAG TPA: flagellar motor protein [Burkholderiales bacterium]|nr:flagellar motor protein [Burkholderiales bacterium]